MWSPSQDYQLGLLTKELLEVSSIIDPFSNTLLYISPVLPPPLLLLLFLFFLLSIFLPTLPPPSPPPLLPLSLFSSFSFFSPKTSTRSYSSLASSITRERVPPAFCSSTPNTVSTSSKHLGGCCVMSYTICTRWTLMGEDIHLS